MKQLFYVLFSAVFLAGCVSAPERVETPAQAQVEPPAPLVLPYTEQMQPVGELDEDLLYSFLAGEIGAHRGELKEALGHYLNAAIIGRNAYAAERATRIALHLNDTTRGLRAARRWVELRPNSRAARQLAAILFLHDAKPEEALQQMQAVVRIADARAQDGFLQVAGTLSTEPNEREAALKLMLDLVAATPGDARAHHGLGVLYAAWRRFGEAEEALRAAIDRQPAWADPHVLLVKVLASSDRRDDALAHLAGTVAANPDNEILRTSYARMLVDAQRYDEALHEFRVLHEAHPANMDVTYGFALLASQQKSWEEARVAWQTLRNERERYDEASYYLAQLEEANGNEELAIGLYGSVDSEEFRIDALIKRTALLAEVGRLAQARDELQQGRVAHVAQAVSLYMAETQLLQEAGEQRLALNLYEEAIGAYPASLDLLYNRALYKGQLGDYEGLEADLREVLAREPDNADALNALGYTLADRNERLDEAYNLVAHALRLKPDSAPVMDSMGWVLYRRGEYAEAVRYLSDALGRLQDAEIAAHLGEVLWITGKREEAQAVWREALIHAPDSDILKAVLEKFAE